MKTTLSRGITASLMIFCVFSLMDLSAQAAQMPGTGWEDIVLSPNPQMDLRQVIQVGLPDMESQVQQLLKDHIEKIKKASQEFENKTGIKAGVSYEIPVTEIEGKGKVSLEFDMLDLAGWDQKSPIPVKVKIEKENVGAIEVQYDPSAPYGIKEIKTEKKMPGGVVSQSGTITVEGTREKPEVKITYGQKAETPEAGGFKGEAEQTIGLDLSRSADDLYDPEWNPRSEWAIVRGIEDIIAMTNWGVKFSGKHEQKTETGEKITTGVDLTVNTDRVRSWWTDWLFSDMNDAFDRLDEQLDRESQWRRDKITAEAERLGIKTDGKTNQQIINEIKAAWNANPGQQRPIFRNPGPKVDPVRMPGSGTKTGDSTQQPGVTLPPPPGGQNQPADPASPGWKNPYKDYTNPYGDYKNPYGNYVNPYK